MDGQVRAAGGGVMPLSAGLYSRLSLMMFLQYAIWGSWLPILYPFLLGHRGFTLDQCGAILAAGAAGAVFGPFIAGQVADRYFHTERFLAASHAIGAALVWFLATVDDFATFLALSVLYGLIYAPTLALTNSLCFHHIPDRDRDFGRVRVWGTIGWIIAGIGLGHWLGAFFTPETPAELARFAAEFGLGAEVAADAKKIAAAAQDAGRADAFRLSALLGAAMAIYCLTLPRTPPAKNAVRRNATFEALGEVRRQPLITLFLIAVPISVIHQFYFVHTSTFLTELQNRATEAQRFATGINRILGVGGGGLMTIGQMAEIVVLSLMPLLARTLTRKDLLSLGIAAYAARMALFAYTEGMAPILLGVALHGLCFGCFIFVAFMVVDEETTADVRASAQNLFNLVFIGIGIICGSWFATSVVAEYARIEGGGTDWTKLFSVPMWIACASFVALRFLYPGGRRAAAPALEGAAA